MKSSTRPRKQATVGRPRSIVVTRTRQLRLAKRAQRVRDGQAGQIEVRLKLPKALAERLLVAARPPPFLAALTQTVDAIIVEVNRYPQLKESHP